MLEKLKKAKPYELQTWMGGAGIFGFGLGAFFANYLGNLSIWIILAGMIMHGWAMYRIYNRK